MAPMICAITESRMNRGIDKLKQTLLWHCLLFDWNSVFGRNMSVFFWVRPPMRDFTNTFTLFPNSTCTTKWPLKKPTIFLFFFLQNSSLTPKYRAVSEWFLFVRWCADLHILVNIMSTGNIETCKDHGQSKACLVKLIFTDRQTGR